MRLDRQFVFAIVAMLMAAGPYSANAATLPLKDGVYTHGACKNGQSEFDESLFVLTKYDPGTAAKPFISPDAEGGMGNCAIRKVTVAASRYSGTAPCTAGNREIPSGTYRFSYDIVDRQTFVSRGKTYRWCADHR